jgi:hypothetical protein
VSKYKTRVLRNIFKVKSPNNMCANNPQYAENNIKGDLKLCTYSSHKIDSIFNNEDSEAYSAMLKKGTMDCLVQDSLKDEIIKVKMSSNLRNSILERTTKKPKSPAEKLSNFLNKTVEIPISYVCTVCIIIFISSTLSTFIVTDNMKTNKKLQGYTNIRVLNISGSNVILPKNIGEVTSNEEN